jgi:potassium-transporting ATPase KdpC subunit
MKHHLLTSVLMTVVTTILLGLVYPLVVTGIAQLTFPEKANGQLLRDGNRAIGSSIIGQPFNGEQYFHSRPSSAGNGYDPTASGGSNLAPTSRKLVEQVAGRSAQERLGSEPVPVDLVTASASGLDPHITPSAAEYQIRRIAEARHLSVDAVRSLVRKHTEQRQFGLLGEARVNVLELNLDLHRIATAR